MEASFAQKSDRGSDVGVVLAWCWREVQVAISEVADRLRKKLRASRSLIVHRSLRLPLLRNPRLVLALRAHGIFPQPTRRDR